MSAEEVTLWVCEECGYFRDERSSGTHAAVNPADPNGRYLSHDLTAVVYVPSAALSRVEQERDEWKSRWQRILDAERQDRESGYQRLAGDSALYIAFWAIEGELVIASPTSAEVDAVQTAVLTGLRRARMRRETREIAGAVDEASGTVTSDADPGL